MRDKKLRKKRRSGAIVFPLAALGIAAVLFVDNSGLFITNTLYELKVPGLPEAFSGFRIVQISDLHGEEFGENSGRLIEQVRSQSPDIIALTGDIVDFSTDLAVLERLVPQLVEIAPVFYVSGNHEWGSRTISKFEPILTQSGATYLKNEYIPLERDGSRIILCGVEDPNSWADIKHPDELIDELRTEYPDDVVVLLGHRNYWVTEYPNLDVSVILCGHAHGGIVRIPFVGGLLDTSHRLFPKYAVGVYESGNYQMVVSRGLSDPIPVPRFLNTPELVTIELQ